MKRVVSILVLALVLGSGAYFISYHLVQRTFCNAPDANEPTAWMHQEFRLSDNQYAQIKNLESDYHPRCVELCTQIEQSHLALKKLIQANSGLTPEVEAALQKDDAVQLQCREAMLGHFYEVSRAMPPEEGKRYLEMMQTQVVDTEKAAMMPDVAH